VQRIASFPKITVTADGRGVCTHVGSRLLADVAAAAGVAEALDGAVGGGRKRRSAHAPGRVLADLAVMLADGGVAIGDLAVLRDQANLFGPVASTATAWRVLASVEESLLEKVKVARVAARERAWLLRGEAGRTVPTVRCAGTVVPGLVIDVDATLVTCHRRNRVRRRRLSTGLVITRCWRGWTTPGRRWRGCCGRETRTRTPPPTTSR
jgi:hypothetical protein